MSRLVIVTRPGAPRAEVCAYCAGEAAYSVRCPGTTIAPVYTCAEPTHWAWLVASVREFIEGLPR